MQGRINIIISLNRKKYLIITIIRLIINYVIIRIIWLNIVRKIYSKVNSNATSRLGGATTRMN